VREKQGEEILVQGEKTTSGAQINLNNTGETIFLETKKRCEESMLNGRRGLIAQKKSSLLQEYERGQKTPKKVSELGSLKRHPPTT